MTNIKPTLVHITIKDGSKKQHFNRILVEETDKGFVCSTSNNTAINDTSGTEWFPKSSANCTSHLVSGDNGKVKK